MGGLLDVDELLEVIGIADSAAFGVAGHSAGGLWRTPKLRRLKAQDAGNTAVRILLLIHGL